LGALTRIPARATDGICRIHVCPETPLTDVASQFVLHRIRRLPVVHDGRVLGVISRRDLLRQFTGANMADDLLAVEMQAYTTR